MHANLRPDAALDQQSSDWLHWNALDPNMHRPHVSGKTMICGHTQQRDGVPLRLVGAICIDTWAYGDGWLTCLDVTTGEYWQANELGQTRDGVVAYGRLMPTKLPSFSRDRAHRNAPTSGRS